MSWESITQRRERDIGNPLLPPPLPSPLLDLVQIRGELRRGRRRRRRKRRMRGRSLLLLLSALVLFVVAEAKYDMFFSYNATHDKHGRRRRRRRRRRKRRTPT